VWLARDYRVPVTPDSEVENGVLIAVVGLLALAGVVLELRRRRVAGLLLLVPVAVIAAALVPQLSPYAGGKLLVVLAPAVSLMAALGALGLLALRSRWARAAGGLGLAVMVVGLALSDGLGYREATLAPPERVRAMENVADHMGGGGLWLVNEWEEFAKYFMRDVKVNAAFEAESPRPAELRVPGPIFGRYYDLDDLTLRYVQSFPGIVKRRSPTASRPPASYELSYANDYYEAWRRRPGVRVVRHLPLGARTSAADRPFCPVVRRLAARARPADRVVAAPRPLLVVLDPVRADTDWPRNPNAPDTVIPIVPGELKGTRRTDGGRFRVWLRGSFGRPTSGYVDGQKVGSAHEINTPGQWVELGEVELNAGAHRLEVRRPGAGLGPGDSHRGELGPLVLEPVSSKSLVTVPPARAASLCDREWDWIELVRG
jgi:hypothetical protein